MKKLVVALSICSSLFLTACMHGGMHGGGCSHRKAKCEDCKKKCSDSCSDKKDGCDLKEEPKKDETKK